MRRLRSGLSLGKLAKGVAELRALARIHYNRRKPARMIRSSRWDLSEAVKVTAMAGIDGAVSTVGALPHVLGKLDPAASIRVHELL